jgi:hypothetical protein
MAQPEIDSTQARRFAARLTNVFIALLLAADLIGMAALIRQPHARGFVMVDVLRLQMLGFSLGLTAYAARKMHLPKSSIPALLAGYGLVGCTSVILFQFIGGYTNNFADIYSLFVIAIIPFQLVLRPLIEAAKPKAADHTVDSYPLS